MRFDRSAVTRVLAAAILLGCVFAGTVHADSARARLTAGRFSHFATANPAHWTTEAGVGFSFSIRPPLGLLQVAFPPRNPMHALDEPERFNSLALLDALLHPTIFSQSIPEQLDGIDIAIRDDSLGISGFVVRSDGSERSVPLSLDAYSGARSARLADRGALPKRWLFGAVRAGSIPIEYSIYSGGLGIELEPGARLERDLADEQLESDTRYELELAASGQLGATLAPVLSAPIELGSGRVHLAARPLLFFDVAWFAVDGSYSFRLSEETGEQEFSAHASYGYPGEGYGVGARLDLGTVYEASDWWAGVGLVNAGSVTRRVGTQLSIDGESREYDTTRTAFAPELTATAAWYPSISTGNLSLHADVALAEYVFPEVGLVYSLDPVVVRVSGHWEDGPALETALGLRFGRFLAEFETSNHPYPFTGERATGFRLALSVLRGGE